MAVVGRMVRYWCSYFSEDILLKLTNELSTYLIQTLGRTLRTVEVHLHIFMKPVT